MDQQSRDYQVASRGFSKDFLWSVPNNGLSLKGTINKLAKYANHERMVTMKGFFTCRGLPIDRIYVLTTTIGIVIFPLIHTFALA
jgi:hypothetical protein